MSPNITGRGRRQSTTSDIYTAILALAFSIILATAALVAYKCYRQYDTVFKTPHSSVSRFGS